MASHRLGADVFVLSGLVSLAAVAEVIYLIKKIAPERPFSHHTALMIGTIYVIFNILYFSNIIPPIPLAIKEAGIYHNVVKMPDGGYSLLAEKRAWYEFFEKNKFYFLPGEPAYAYSAVFAPTKLEGEIFHRWSFYDERQKKWIESSRIGFSIVGGRDRGYRGYSAKENIFPGLWRIDVITKRGQIIGRVKFRAIETDVLPELESRNK